MQDTVRSLRDDPNSEAKLLAVMDAFPSEWNDLPVYLFREGKGIKVSATWRLTSNPDDPENPYPGADVPNEIWIMLGY